MLSAFIPGTTLPTHVNTESASNLAEPSVRKALGSVLVKKDKPEAQEGAWLKPYDCSLVVERKRGIWTVVSKKITVEIDGSQVKVISAKTVHLYSSVLGLEFSGLSQTSFALDVAPGIRTVVTDNPAKLYFHYGSALFLINQDEMIVKVWAPKIRYKIRGETEISFGESEPRPNVEFLTSPTLFPL